MITASPSCAPALAVGSGARAVRGGSGREADGLEKVGMVRAQKTSFSRWMTAVNAMLWIGLPSGSHIIRITFSASTSKLTSRRCRRCSDVCTALDVGSKAVMPVAWKIRLPIVPGRLMTFARRSRSLIRRIIGPTHRRAHVDVLEKSAAFDMQRKRRCSLPLRWPGDLIRKNPLRYAGTDDSRRNGAHRERAIMLSLMQTPTIRLGNLFPRHEVYAKCEFLAPSGCFKIRGAAHLLDHLSREGDDYVRPTDRAVDGKHSGLGAATAAQAFGFRTGWRRAANHPPAPRNNEKLRALGVELIKDCRWGQRPVAAAHHRPRR